MTIRKIVLTPPHGTAFKNETGSTVAIHFDDRNVHPLELYPQILEELRSQFLAFVTANPEFQPPKAPTPVPVPQPQSSPRTTSTHDPLDLAPRRIYPDERHLREAKGPSNCLTTGDHDKASIRRIPRSENGICMQCGTQLPEYFKPLERVQTTAAQTEPAPALGQSVALGDLAIAEAVLNAGADAGEDK